MDNQWFGKSLSVQLSLLKKEHFSYFVGVPTKKHPFAVSSNTFLRWRSFADWFFVSQCKLVTHKEGRTNSDQTHHSYDFYNFDWRQSYRCCKILKMAVMGLVVSHTFSKIAFFWLWPTYANDLSHLNTARVWLKDHSCGPLLNWIKWFRSHLKILLYN